jgi:hypothetical protein
MTDPTPGEPLTFRPIGIIRSPFVDIAGMPIGARLPEPHDVRHPVPAIECCSVFRHTKELTARAITRPTTTNEIKAWQPMATLAQCTIGRVSVGLNALAVVNPR